MSSFCASGLVNLSTGSARELWVTCPLKTSQIPLVTCDGEGPVANEGPQEMGTRKQQVNALAPNKSRRRGEQPKDLAVDGMTKVINDLPFYPPPPLSKVLKKTTNSLIRNLFISSHVIHLLHALSAVHDDRISRIRRDPANVHSTFHQNVAGHSPTGSPGISRNPVRNGCVLSVADDNNSVIDRMRWAGGITEDPRPVIRQWKTTEFIQIKFN